MAEKTLLIPDIGDFEGVDVIEVMVQPGDTIEVEASLVTLESDKAAMDIPSTDAGTVKEVLIKVGDKVKEGDPLVLIETGETSEKPVKTPEEPIQDETKQPAAIAEKAGTSPAAADKPVKETEIPAVRPSPTTHIDEVKFSKAHASPSVRKFARELGVDLGQVTGSGRKERILKEDVKQFVKRVMSGGGMAGGLNVAPMPEIDFSTFGEVERKALSKINKLTGQFLHRNWVTIPHVTQFDEADITELESFRRSMVDEYKDKGIKITLLVFLMKAVVSALREFPRFNSSLDSTQENLFLKKYFHIGIAVDTPDGLVVPVIRDVDRKSLVELAAELGEVSVKAREKKLNPSDMQGGCMTISSLGGLGGTSFTPIVNAPEVAILGVSRSTMKPVWDGENFQPRLMLPLSLSYDHRVIDGADGARFTTYLTRVLSDTRRLLL
ncbi:MAG: dihydrolipoyllysine-residue acetyltransferase [Gammaproteobacteria bacterium]|nr:MAG: dihydrolipoyllysine-residue acetyltransferase [Gammaproteobacteria bacterium]